MDLNDEMNLDIQQIYFRQPLVLFLLLSFLIEWNETMAGV